jgi:Outer membrane protein beta-barrel domain
MEQFDNNHMDDIFRKAADESHYDFNPDAWERLEEQLVTTYDSMFFRKALKFKALEIAALVLISTFALTLTNVFSNKKVEATKINNESESLNANKKPIFAIKTSKQIEEKSSVSSEKITKYNSQNQGNPATENQNSIASNFLKSVNNFSKKEKLRQSIQGKSHDFKNQNFVINEPINNIEVQNTTNELPENQAFKNINQATEALNSKEKLSQLSVSDLANTEEFDYPIQEVLPKKKARISDKGNLSILVGYAPDLSSVGFKNFGEIGQNANFQLKYQVLKNWGISAGVTISDKKYNALPEEYRPQPQIWTIWAKPDRISGDSKILDISLNIHRTLVCGDRFKIYATTGLSSYWILEEKYQYYFDVTGSKMDVPVNKESQAIFGVSNFSIGYEQKLNNRLALVAEPYLKTPLTQVGFAKMRLFSAGLNVSVKYNLGKF